MRGAAWGHSYFAGGEGLGTLIYREGQGSSE
jgi:hypothetical protein